MPNVHAVKFSVPCSSCESMMRTSDRLPNMLPVGKRIAGHISTSNVGHINYSQDIPFSAKLRVVKNTVHGRKWEPNVSIDILDQWIFWIFTKLFFNKRCVIGLLDNEDPSICLIFRRFLYKLSWRLYWIYTHMFFMKIMIICKKYSDLRITESNQFHLELLLIIPSFIDR